MSIIPVLHHQARGKVLQVYIIHQVVLFVWTVTHTRQYYRHVIVITETPPGC